MRVIACHRSVFILIFSDFLEWSMSEEGVKIESATNNSGYREQPGYIVVKEEFEVILFS